jgi:hypothetical protein
MILITILTVYLCVYGLHTAIHYFAEYVDFDLGFWANHDFQGNYRPFWIRSIARPLFLCNVCMSSLWGTVFYLLASGTWSFSGWVITCLSVAALISISNKVLDKYEDTYVIGAN